MNDAPPLFHIGDMLIINSVAGLERRRGMVRSITRDRWGEWIYSLMIDQANGGGHIERLEEYQLEKAP